jgi:hypothetical protein
MASTPRDRFDDIPADLVRVGAHRAPPKRGGGWVRFAWFALATGLLIVAGLYGLSRINPAISFELPVIAGGGADPTSTPSTAPVVPPMTVEEWTAADPAIPLTISVLNGSPTDGAQNQAALQVGSAGWPAPDAQNASARDVATTLIYYHEAKYEGIAKSLAAVLGIDPTHIKLSDYYLGAPVTIVLGADYTPPA